MTRTILAPLLVMLLIAGVLRARAGCNIRDDVGTDIQQGGKALKDEATERKIRL